MNTPPSFIESAFADPASLAAAARLRVVLVGTQHPGNIGAAARALKTMGLARLVLVAPEDYPAEEAYRRAAGADDLLGDAPVVDTLAEAVADCHLVLGCTARSRRVQLEEHAPRQAAAVAVARAAAGGEVALVFGRERTGLSNEELQLCHAAVHIPANPGYSSLNLAAAVQVLAYELRLALLEGAAPATAEPVHPDEVPASHAHMEGFFTQLGDTLDAIDFHKGRTPDSAMRKLRRLFAKAQLNEQEVRLLRGILADAQRMARLAGGGGTGSLS
jgi:tRNA (cytidine32/uridine32-2'-O)-methyltransferase